MYVINDPPCNSVYAAERLNKRLLLLLLYKKANYAITSIGRIRKYLPSNGLKMLVNSLVISRLDYCNSLLYDIPKYQRDKLQRIQNTAARMITGARSSDHITPLLKSLHWLPVEARIAPWGTPDLTEDHEEVVPRTTTRCCRFDKKFLKQCNRLPSIP